MHGNFFGQQWFTRTGKQTTNLASINKGVLRSFPVPIAPLNEQHRIVAKVEELFSDLNVAVATLERVQAKLKRYRAAVLKAAIDGKLTADWRTRHPATEPASGLLDRILTERRSRWENAQRAKFTAADKEPPKGWQAKYPEAIGPETAKLPQLPDGWCWASVEQMLAEPSCNGISVKGADSPPGVPALRLSAMTDGGFDYSSRRYIPITDDVADHLAISADDFFVARGNGSLHLVGRGTLAQQPPERIVFPDTMIRLRFVEAGTLGRFIRLAWQSRWIALLKS
jgi:type I restriction enzyme S subunit